MADKRIRDLQAQPLPLLSDFLATDRTGALEATRMTVQQLVNIIGTNLTKQVVYANNTAPDNAFGLNGDLFFRIPASGYEIQMYQKIGSAWVSVFTLPISTEITLVQNPADPTPVLLDDGGGGYYADASSLLPDNKIIGGYAIINKSGVITSIAIQLTEDRNSIIGFLDNSIQTITVKLL